MNTLSRQLTARFFSSPYDYHKFRLYWSELLKSERKHELKAVHHLAYLVFCGKDWRKAFSFPTSPNKLNNGYTPELYRALQQFDSVYQEQSILCSFNGLVSKETIAEARKLLSHVLTVPPKAAQDGSYTCDAYTALTPLHKEE